MTNLHTKGITQTHVVNFDSLFAEKHESSSNFTCRLPSLYKDVIKIHLISGNIPQTDEPFLFLDINELNDKKIINSKNNGTYFAMLRYPLPAVTEQNLLDLNKRSSKVNGVFGKISRLNFKIYNRFGELANFGISKLTVVNFDNLNPAQVHTSQNHTLLNGDEVYVTNFLNGSNASINNYINTTRFTILTTGVNQFTLTGLDLTGEAINSGNPADGPPYPLGSHTSVTNETGSSYPVALIAFVGPNLTTLTLGRPYNNFTTNQTIKITGCDNCASIRDNDLINAKYVITNANLDVTRTILTLPITAVLSSYVTPSKKTGSKPDYPLGQNSEIWVVKRQVSFDIKFKYKSHTIEGLHTF